MEISRHVLTAASLAANVKPSGRLSLQSSSPSQGKCGGPSTSYSDEVDHKVATMSARGISTVFDKKVSDTCASTSGTAALSFAATDCVLSSFKWVTQDDVVVALPNKQCTSDPIQT